MNNSVEKILYLCTSLILIIEFFERVGFYGTVTNLVLVARTRFRFSNTESINVTLYFLGFSNVFPLFTTWLAETCLGKFNTILASCLIYNYGTGLLLYLHHDSSSLSIEYERVLFYLALLVISLGTAGMKSNISAFGISQIKSRIKEKCSQEEKVKRFFKWFYYLINIGSLLSITLIAYVQVYYPFYGFIPVSGSLFICLVLLIIGRRYFTCVPCNGSQLTDIVRVTKYAIKRKFSERRRIKNSLPDNVSLDLLDYAHMTYGGKYTTSQVDVVRCAIRIFILQSSMILYWISYFQMSTSFILQGEHMNLSIGNDFKIPSSSLGVIDIAMLLIVSFLLKKLILPCLRKLRIKVTLLRKIGTGMIFGILSMVAAALTEKYRKKSLQHSMENKYAGVEFEASSLRVYFQIPQYVLMGISEVLTTISGLEFTYSQTPKFLHSTMMALYLSTCGIGAFLSCIIVKVVSMTTNWICLDLNECKFEYYFYFVAGLTALDLLIFLIFAHKYSYIEDYFTGVISAVADSRSSRNSSFSGHASEVHACSE